MLVTVQRRSLRIRRRGLTVDRHRDTG